VCQRLCRNVETRDRRVSVRYYSVRLAELEVGGEGLDGLAEGGEGDVAGVVGYVVAWKDSVLDRLGVAKTVRTFVPP